MLVSSGIRAVLLKGATWLFDGSLAAPFDRMMRDIDLLIASDQTEVATTVLVSAGYRQTFDKPHSQYASFLGPTGEARVKLHRAVSRRVNLLPSEELIASASEVAPGLLLPVVHHRIAHNIIHGQIESGNFVCGIVNLRDALDLVRLTVSCGPEFDWRVVAAEARDRGFFRHLSGAIHVTHRFLNSPLPIPLESSSGEVHAWRCTQQRQWPVASSIAEGLAHLSDALASDRDAYSLGVGTNRSLKMRLLANKLRTQSSKAIPSGLRSLLPKFLNGEKRDELTETPHEWTGRHSSVRYTPTRPILEPVFDRKMVDVASGRTPVLLDWAPSNIYGWGISGLNTFMAWANDGELQPLMGAPITEDSLAGYTSDRLLAIEQAIAESNRVQSYLAPYRAAAMRIDIPIVKVFGNGLNDPGGLVGNPNIGRCIFEDTRLEKVDDKLANCDAVVCVSRWNVDLLREKTAKRIEVIHEGVDETLFKPRPRSQRFDHNKFYIFSGGKVEYRKGHDLVLLAFKEFSRRHDDAILVTAWHSPWPQLSNGFKGKLNAPLELADDGTINVEKWVILNGINLRQGGRDKANSQSIDAPGPS